MVFIWKSIGAGPQHYSEPHESKHVEPGEQVFPIINSWQIFIKLTGLILFSWFDMLIIYDYLRIGELDRWIYV